jgi:hypothetical protein
MRIKRRLPVVFGFLVLLLAVAAVVELRKHAPPEPARLLPGADGFLYLDLKWMRRAEMTRRLPLIAHDPEYEQFIQATGFEFERDLEEAALAIHYPSRQSGDETRYSELFVGRIDGAKLRAYLGRLARSVDSYRGIVIYNIPIEDRVFRVAILGIDTVAASNHNDPAVIRGIIDRSRKLASPFAGPTLLRQYYKKVPLASLAWGILRVNSSYLEAGAGWSLPLPSSTTVVVSVRYLGAVHFRAEAFAPDESSAERLASDLTTFIRVFQTAEISASGSTPDPDIKKALESLKVEQRRDRAIVTATIPSGLLNKLVSEAPREIGSNP